MSLLNQIHLAQRDAGEQAVMRNLDRLGLGSVGSYATAEDTASVTRQGTPDELWLNAQLDRIAPNRFDADAGESDALSKLVFEQREAKTQLRGEANVMRVLLEEALKVISTLEPDEDNEHARLESLKKMIIAVVEMQLVQI